jgi:DNA-binding PadR family transcriptional regulator
MVERRELVMTGHAEAPHGFYWKNCDIAGPLRMFMGAWQGRRGMGRGFGPPDFLFRIPGPWGGPKAGRGDMRTAILTLLGEGPMHGYQIIQEITERSGGIWRPSPGSVYPTLSQLEDEGLVAGEKQEGKKVYRLTDEGREHLGAIEEDAAPWEEMVTGFDPSVFEMRDLGFQVAAAFMQVMQAGSKEQVSKAQDILKETRRRLYALLAEE